MNDNEDRLSARIRAETAIRAAYPKGDEDERITQAQDLITDLLHFLDASGAAFTPEVYAERAVEHWEAERPGGEDDDEGEREEPHERPGGEDDFPRPQGAES